jgi:hypothetical protein
MSQQSAETTMCVAESMVYDSRVNKYSDNDVMSVTAKSEGIKLNVNEISAGDVHAKPYQPRNMQFPAQDHL